MACFPDLAARDNELRLVAALDTRRLLALDQTGSQPAICAASARWATPPFSALPIRPGQGLRMTADSADDPGQARSAPAAFSSFSKAADIDPGAGKFLGCVEHQPVSGSIISGLTWIARVGATCFRGPGG